MIWELLDYLIFGTVRCMKRCTMGDFLKKSF